MEYICIGKIVNTHGIKGELRLLSDFEFKEKVFLPNTKIYIGKKKELETIATYRHHKSFEMITFVGYNNINDVLKYKGLPAYVEKEFLQLSDTEVLDEELLQMKVLVDGVQKGVIVAVETMQKGNKILKIEEHGKTVMVPYHPDFIESLSKEKGEIAIRSISGLFS